MFKKYFYPPIALTAVCVIIAFMLSAVNNFTKPVIEAGLSSEEDMARSELLPEAERFEEIEVEGIENLLSVYKAENGAGYVFTVKAKGFAGDIVVLTAISDGKIVGVRMTEHNETSGYGSRAADDNYDYTSQYKGVGKDLEGVKIISGSTYTSRAFEKAVKTAFDAYGRVE